MELASAAETSDQGRRKDKFPGAQAKCMFPLRGKRELCGNGLTAGSLTFQGIRRLEGPVCEGLSGQRANVKGFTGGIAEVRQGKGRKSSRLDAANVSEVPAR